MLKGSQDWEDREGRGVRGTWNPVHGQLLLECGREGEEGSLKIQTDLSLLDDKERIQFVGENSGIYEGGRKG